MDNYIVINGKRAELTEEQLKALGIATEKENPFQRAIGKNYYHIDTNGNVLCLHDTDNMANEIHFEHANYCTDKNLLQQRALHEILSRLLWRYSMEHDGNKIDWKDWHQPKAAIYYDYKDNKFRAGDHRWAQYNSVFFHTKEIAENAINDIVKPFMAEHPYFIW